MQDIIIVGIIMTIVTTPWAQIKANSLISTKPVIIITNLILVLFIRSFVRDTSIIIIIIITMAMAMAIANLVGIIMRFTMSNKKTLQ
jgi:hypothetical protein